MRVIVSFVNDRWQSFFYDGSQLNFKIFLNKKIIENTFILVILCLLYLKPQYFYNVVYECSLEEITLAR